jgi:acyl-CoA thioesterase FadM
MRLGDLTTNGISLRFEYLRKTNTGLILAARGEQKIVCMRRELDRLSPVPVPPVLRDALRAFE